LSREGESPLHAAETGNEAEALVIETTNFEDQFIVARDVGVGAADYLMRVVQPQDSIVISWGGIVSLVFFVGIAVAVEFIRTTDVSGVVIGAFILVGIGVIILAKALFFREG
jgi:hypothetical protein